MKKKKKTTMVRANIGLDNNKEQWKQFKGLCHKRGKTASEVLRAFIQEYEKFYHL